MKFIMIRPLRIEKKIQFPDSLLCEGFLVSKVEESAAHLDESILPSSPTKHSILLRDTITPRPENIFIKILSTARNIGFQDWM